MKKPLIILLCMLFITARCFAGTFGRTTTAETSGTVEDRIYALIATMDDVEGQKAFRISAYIEVTITNKLMKAALYNNTTDAWIATTEERLIGVGTGWRSFTFSTPPDLTANQEYIIAVFSEVQTGYGYLRYDYTLPSSGYLKTHTYDGFPDPLGGTANTFDACLYVTYAVEETRIYDATIYDATIYGKD